MTNTKPIVKNEEIATKNKVLKKLVQVDMESKEQFAHSDHSYDYSYDPSVD